VTLQADRTFRGPSVCQSNRCGSCNLAFQCLPHLQVRRRTRQRNAGWQTSCAPKHEINKPIDNVAGKNMELLATLLANLKCTHADIQSTEVGSCIKNCVKWPTSYEQSGCLILNSKVVINNSLFWLIGALIIVIFLQFNLIK